MKKKRLAKILELIEQFDIDTQEMMQSLLQQHGFDVTQATVSRDIKELRLLKAMSDKGVYRYTSAAVDYDKQGRLDSIFKSSVLSVDYALNTVVIKCEVGMAQAACASFDAMNFEGVMGSLAGDDTIFILMKSEQNASELVKSLIKHIEKK